jgi:hypothetical protein
MKMSIKNLPLIGRRLTTLPCIVMLVVATLSIVACGDHLIRGVSPVVRINELSHENQTITLQLSLRNRNGVEMDVQHMDFSLSVEEEVMLAYNGPAETNVVANGTETWTVEIAETESSLALLNSLQNGEVKSLPYSFSGKVTSVVDGELKFEHEGHLYPVPGRPGKFR